MLYLMFVRAEYLDSAAGTLGVWVPILCHGR
jgi:hypothetical protein